ncbi:MAG: hypothetical protein MJE68_03165 [Proteobacteria bacterium]|nr:hypothetical protein [Pseudomonadota bacterium]
MSKETSRGSDTYSPRLEGDAFAKHVESLYRLLDEQCKRAAEWGANKALREAGVFDNDNKRR